MAKKGEYLLVYRIFSCIFGLKLSRQCLIGARLRTNKDIMAVWPMDKMENTYYTFLSVFFGHQMKCKVIFAGERTTVYFPAIRPIKAKSESY